LRSCFSRSISATFEKLFSALILAAAFAFCFSRAGSRPAACGNDMNSILAGTYPAGGITLGPALTFGYIAGLHMADVQDVASAPLETGVDDQPSVIDNGQ
jgi:hypothetical protein